MPPENKTSTSQAAVSGCPFHQKPLAHAAIGVQLPSTGTHTVRPAVRHYDLEAPALFLNPHPLLHRMRVEEPVYWSPQLESWVLTSYHDVCDVFRDPRFSVVEGDG
jgi:cytochrome P450